MKRVLPNEAKDIIHSRTVKKEKTMVPVKESLGYILGEDIKAKMSQPPFSRSAMDGYVVNKSDLKANDTFKIIAQINAGDTNEYSFEGSDKGFRIMTGARVPEGSLFVIPQENTTRDGDSFTVNELSPRDNIVPVGEDFSEGELLACEGVYISPATVSCFTAAGVSEVFVYKKPRVSIVSTGSELVSIGKPLMPGQIYDSNKHYIEARVKELGLEIPMAISVKDDEETIKNEIQKAASCSDFVITTGGVSVGDKDLLEPVLQSLGADILFHGIAVKPGMPTMFSVLNGIPVLSLSGNPSAASLVFEYVFPYTRSISTKAAIKDTYSASHDNLRLVRGVVKDGVVTVLKGQKNGSTKQSVMSNCVVLIPPGKEDIKGGDLVDILIL